MAWKRPPGEEAYLAELHVLVEGFSLAFEDLRLRARFGDGLFITFAGVDPNPLLVNAERTLVRRLNDAETFAEWSLEND